MIDIKVDDRAATALFQRITDKARDPSPFYQIVGTIVAISVRKNFDEGGRYAEEGSWRGGSRRWKPLAPQTLLNSLRSKSDHAKGGGLTASGAQKAANRKPLNASAQLRDSITYHADGTGVTIGTNKIYAATHQFGAHGRVIQARNKKCLAFPYGGKVLLVRRVKVTIPARPFLVVQDEDLAAIKKEGQHFLTESK